MTTNSQTETFNSESLDSLIGQVADDFLARQERGENPTIEEYAAKYPAAAAAIREALAMLRLVGTDRQLVDEHAGAVIAGKYTLSR